ncbi:MAG: peptidase M28 family protein, partial [Sphingomonas sp.]|nr:peptidase M28 family protein [Sphingomonas sp.]
MTKTLLAALLTAAAAPALSQPAPPPPIQVPAQIAQLRQSALGDDYAWDIVEGLTTEVGPRLAGTEAEARARDWSVRKLRALGFANPRIETFDMPVWVRGE